MAASDPWTAASGILQESKQSGSITTNYECECIVPLILVPIFPLLDILKDQI